jgi:hypothetical protein
MSGVESMSAALALDGIATEQMVQRAIRSRESHGGSLALHFVLHGVLPGELVAEYFARRYRLRRAQPLDLELNGSDVLTMLPLEVIAEAGLIPLMRQADRKLLVGWVDPTEPGRIEEAEFFSGHVVEPLVITAHEMARSFERMTGNPWRVSLHELEQLRPGDAACDPDARPRIFEWLDLVAMVEADIQPGVNSSGSVSAAIPRQQNTSEEASVASGVAGSPVRPAGYDDLSMEIRLTDYVTARDAAVADSPRSQTVTPADDNRVISVKEEHEFLSTSLPQSGSVLVRPSAVAIRDNDEEPREDGLGSKPTVQIPSLPSLRPTPESIAPPVAEPTADPLNPSLTTGTFLVPSPEMLAQKRVSRPETDVQPYFRNERQERPTTSSPLVVADMPSVPAPSAVPRREGSYVSTGSHRHATQGSFGRPARIFEATGPAAGVTRAAFRTVVKGLDVTDERDAIAREIVEGLGLVFATACLMTLKVPGLAIWQLSQWEGSPLVIGRRFDMPDDSLWARVTSEGVAFRGRIPDEDPMRRILRGRLGNDSIVMPLAMNRRTIAVLLLDGATRGDLPGLAGQFEPFDAAVTGAFRRMILNRKRPQWHNPSPS